MKRGDAYPKSELVLGLAVAVGTPLDDFEKILRNRLREHGHEMTVVRVSEHVIPEIGLTTAIERGSRYEEMDSLMRAGNEARRLHGNDVLADGVAAHIAYLRKDEDPPTLPRTVFLARSLKHPDEVARLRDIYGPGFFLVAIHAPETERVSHLVNVDGLTQDEAEEAVSRDRDEGLKHGQRTRDVFQLADFYLVHSASSDKFGQEVNRMLGLLFGNPCITPRLDEHAMFMAFAASSRSGDLSRQVGAAIVVDREVIATGANEVPRARGGQYWPDDLGCQRDIERGHDANRQMRDEIISAIARGCGVKQMLSHLLATEPGGKHHLGDDQLAEAARRLESGIASLLAELLGDASTSISLGRAITTMAESAARSSGLADITEYGRAVHAEMHAILSCARRGAATNGATLYSTTFPCHNCAKHIVASGITDVVYVEPYPKSKAYDLHNDSIELMQAGDGHASRTRDATSVRFRPFVGVGPRRFLDLFSLNLGSGYQLKRKDSAGNVVAWLPRDACLRTPLLPDSYLVLEQEALDRIAQIRCAR